MRSTARRAAPLSVFLSATSRLFPLLAVAALSAFALGLAGVPLAGDAVAASAVAESDAGEAPETFAWATRAAHPVVNVRAVGAYYPANGKVYVLGGRSSDLAGSDNQVIREYDPKANSWATKTATLPTNQVNNMVGGVLRYAGSDVIVMVGGSAAAQVTATADVRAYNPLTDSIIPFAGDPWPGGAGGTTLPGGAAVYNNMLYVFGGFNINAAMVNGIWRFDPAQANGARWTTLTTTLSVARGYIPTATAGAHIYLLGGSDYVGGLVIDTPDAFRFDPAVESITPIAAVPRAVGETRAVRNVDGRLYVLGGGRTAPNPSNLVDSYNPFSNTWSAGPPMPTAKRNFAADVDPVSGDIFTVGGYAPTAATDVHEVLSENRIFNHAFENGSFCGWSGVPAHSYGFELDLHGDMVDGSVDTGNHTDDGSTLVALPFAYTVYDSLFPNTNVGSNGHLTFGAVQSGFNLPCMPVPTATYAIGPYWTDQCTAPCGNVSPCTGCGIFTSTTGSAPTRIFNVEYRTRYFNSGGDGIPLNYVVRLYEGQQRYDVIYGTVNSFNPSSDGALNVGVQRGPTASLPFTLVGCDPNQGANPPVFAGDVFIWRGCGPPV